MARATQRSLGRSSYQGPSDISESAGSKHYKSGKNFRVEKNRYFVFSRGICILQTKVLPRRIRVCCVDVFTVQSIVRRWTAMRGGAVIHRETAAREEARKKAEIQSESIAPDLVSSFWSWVNSSIRLATARHLSNRMSVMYRCVHNTCEIQIHAGLGVGTVKWEIKSWTLGWELLKWNTPSWVMEGYFERISAAAQAVNYFLRIWLAFRLIEADLDTGLDNVSGLGQNALMGTSISYRVSWQPLQRWDMISQPREETNPKSTQCSTPANGKRAPPDTKRARFAAENLIPGLHKDES
ncbi:hypothetical protein C8R44DRAFT_728235 [Mycena epipterygia]|nr:hypothetical protein C8R44DRAFT_728235 [Mycena epipterygia]